MAENKNNQKQVEDPSKRDFLVMAANGIGAVGAACVAWPIVNSMNPSEEVLAQSSIEVDLAGIESGQQKKVMWRGKPVFVYHRTPEQIKEAQEAKLEDLKDPQADAERVKAGKDEWLVVIGVCTHLGCIPIQGEGNYDGWFCPCHGSHYDSSARIRKGPAPSNLPVPPYEFVSDTKIKIG